MMRNNTNDIIMMFYFVWLNQFSSRGIERNMQQLPRFVVEFIATIVFLMIIVLADAKFWAVGIAIAGLLYVTVPSHGEPLSYGCFNPATTVVRVLMGDASVPASDLITVLGVQFLAALVVAMFFRYTRTSK